jgi:eukaryotic-like serine/threonine-protein kinase
MEPAVDAFLRTVVRSGVMDPQDVKGTYRTVPKEQRLDPRHVADHFVKQGKLSRFQATKLLSGRAQGLVLGLYQVLAPIGRGGMGAVFLARDKSNQQLVALKVLPPQTAKKERKMQARFKREMELCKRVSHAHIARSFYVGVDLGVYYIAMEFIPGRDLSKLVQAQGPLTVPRAAKLFAEVAWALQHAHAQGVIHRDLKPSNIRVTPSDHAKVLDLGLALLEGEENTDREVVGGEGYVVGSMDYIAPEQTYDACAVDGRADLYSLGCTMYFALTGRPPFPGGTNREKIFRQRNDEPALITERNPAIPPRFAEIVHRLMAKKPEQRYESAEVVRRELMVWAPKEEAPSGEQNDDMVYRQTVASLQEVEASDDVVALAVAGTPEDRELNVQWLVAGTVVGLWFLLMMIVLIVAFLR